MLSGRTALMALFGVLAGLVPLSAQAGWHVINIVVVGE